MKLKQPLGNSRLHSTHGTAAPLIVIGVVAVALLGFAGYYFVNQSDGEDLIDPIMATVARGEFVSQVLDQGEIQSSENVEIRCEVRARNGSLSVIRLKPEGALVKPGDFLVELDSTSFEKELEQQNIALANAETSVIQAETALASAIATRTEYIEGLFVENQKTILNEIYDADSDITTAQQNLSQAEDVLEHSKKLLAKGFESKQTVDANRFEVTKYKIALIKGENSKALAEKKLEVLENITFEKEKVQLDADIKAARVKFSSEQKALAVEKETLAEIKEMIAKCTILVPEGVSGQVVYAKESSRGGNDWMLEEGTSVRENQVLVRLPNPDKMEVKALINEQSITRISTNMPVTIKVDALNSQTLKGIVTRVNQYAESGGWMGGSIRKYAVLVKILDPPEALKPGMNASVTIQVQYESDVLTAPIQTIYGVQDKQYCLGRGPDGEWKTLEVELGGDNSQMVYFTDGVEDGTELVMNPGKYKNLMDLPEFKHDSKIELPEGAVSQVGKTSSESGGDAKAKGDRAQRASGRPGGQGRSGGGRSGGGMGGFTMPANGAALISSKDTDGDGKLSTDEAGPMYGRADSDGDGFITESEADEALDKFKKRMQEFQNGGGGMGGRGGGGGQRGGRGE